MPIAPRLSTVKVTAASLNSAVLDCRGAKIMAVYVPTLGTATTVKIQGSADGSSFADLKDTTPSTVGSFGSSSGDFWMDAEVVCRFLGIRYLRFVLGGAQAADVTFTVVLSEE